MNIGEKVPAEIIQFEMVEHFGGYQQYLETPYNVMQAHELVWRARNLAQAEQTRRDTEKMQSG